MATTTTSTAATHWNGDLFSGSGTTSLETSGAATFDVNWGKRAEAGPGTTNPEELLAAAYATCYSMALSNKLAQGGHPPTTLDTSASVTFEPGVGVTRITLQVSADVAGLSEHELRAEAEWAKDNCPIGAALAAVEDKQVTVH